MSPNSNNPVLVSRIDDHSPRRKKKLPVQSAVLLSSAPRRLTGQNVGGVSLGYEGVHVYRGRGFHGAHAGSRRRSLQRAPSLQISRANLSWQKLWRAVRAQTSTPPIPRTLRLANSNFQAMATVVLNPTHNGTARQLRLQLKVSAGARPGWVRRGQQQRFF